MWQNVGTMGSLHSCNHSYTKVSCANYRTLCTPMLFPIQLVQPLMTSHYVLVIAIIWKSGSATHLFKEECGDALKVLEQSLNKRYPPHTHTFSLSFFLFPQCTVSCDPLLTDTGRKYVPESTTLQKLWNSRTLCIIVW